VRRVYLLEALGGRHELSCPVERTQAHAETGESVRPALLAIDHADRVPDDQTGFPQGLDGLRERVHLYYDDGSMVTLERGAPEAERLLAVARSAL